MTEAFRKDTMRTMRKTMNRFCSILLIVALGVGFFAGVRATGDDMRDTASDYYIDYNAMDVKVLSTLGFSENDVAAVAAVDGVKQVYAGKYVDCLTLTASVQQKEVVETLKAMRMVKEQLGCRTLLGVSNISFGLPNRELLNHSFLLMALEAGLDLPIINPNVPSMLDAIRAFEVLYAKDEHAARYIENFSRPEEIARISAKPTVPTTSAVQTSGSDCDPLTAAIQKGLGESVRREVCLLLEGCEAETIINERLIPALDLVGQEFESGKIFLPQMIQSAQAAQAGFEEIKRFLSAHPQQDSSHQPLDSKGIVLATVHGDVHDIGKNIVKVILENYGFPVIDLGRDVPAERVVQAVREHGIRLVGLSALMTTTLKSMEETIALLHQQQPDCKIMVGGAVLTEEYAKKIGADFYAKDAKASADIARSVLL